MGDFQSLAPSFSNENDFIINLDANLLTHQVRGRFLYEKLRAPDFNQFQPQKQFLGTNAADARKAIVTDAWAINSRFVNDFRISYSRLAGPDVIPPARFADFPNVIIDELSSNTGPEQLAPQGYTQNVYQLVDNITFIRGRSTWKWGVEARKYIAPVISLPRARGEWDYTSLEQFINELCP